MLSLSVIDDMFERLRNGRRTMTVEEATQRLHAAARAWAAASLADVERGTKATDEAAMDAEDELREAAYEFAKHPAAAEKGESELVAALTEITEHFVSVLRGPVVSQHIRFANGVENIPTIKNARAILAKHAAPPSEG